MTSSELRALDKQYVWHPFTHMRQWLADDPLVITVDGREMAVPCIRKVLPFGRPATIACGLDLGRPSVIAVGPEVVIAQVKFVTYG